MCNFNEGFILCKCNDAKAIIHNKKTKRRKKKRDKQEKKPIEYVWRLYKYLGLSKEKELGRYRFPSDDVGNGLTSNYVLQELNNRNCFDFDYTPNEGDNLLISTTESYNRIEFIFRKGKWVEDHYSPFDDEYLEFDNGKITKAN